MILPGMIVSCSNPNLSGGTVLATRTEDWDSDASPTLLRVDFGSGNVIWVHAANCFVQAVLGLNFSTTADSQYVPLIGL